MTLWPGKTWKVREFGWVRKKSGKFYIWQVAGFSITLAVIWKMVKYSVLNSRLRGKCKCWYRFCMKRIADCLTAVTVIVSVKADSPFSVQTYLTALLQNSRVFSASATGWTFCISTSLVMTLSIWVCRVVFSCAFDADPLTKQCLCWERFFS